jgi:hypothetical protein
MGGAETTDTEAEIATPQGTAATDGMVVAADATDGMMAMDGMMATVTITGVIGIITADTPIITANTDTVITDTDTIRITVPRMRMRTHTSYPHSASVLVLVIGTRPTTRRTTRRITLSRP